MNEDGLLSITNHVVSTMVSQYKNISYNEHSINCGLIKSIPNLIEEDKL